MKRLLPLLVPAYIVGLSHYGARFYGEDWRLDFLVVLVGLYLGVAGFSAVAEWHVRRTFDHLHPKELAALEHESPEVAELIADRTRVNERRDWAWRLSDTVGGFALTFYPPVAYTVVRYRTLTSDTPVDSWAILCMALGLATYALWRRWRLQTYRCPGCRCATVPLIGERIRRSCSSCGTTWQLGNRMLRV